MNDMDDSELLDALQLVEDCEAVEIEAAIAAVDAAATEVQAAAPDADAPCAGV